MSVHLASQGREIATLWPMLLLSTAFVMIGTVVGTRWLRRILAVAFRRVVALMLFTLGGSMILVGAG